MNYIDEIKKLTFNLSNPWDIDDFILSGVKQFMTEDEYADFTKTYYDLFITEWTAGEESAGHLYLMLSKHPRINKQFSDFYKLMAGQEKLHARMLAEIRKQLENNGTKPFKSQPTLDLCGITMASFIAESAVECNLDFWCEKSTSDDKRVILKKILDDERGHIPHQVEVMREFVSECPESMFDFFIKATTESRYPMINMLKERFNNDQQILDSVYSTEWTKQLSRKILETHFTMCNVFDADIDLSTFDSMTQIKFNPSIAQSD